MRVLRVGRAMFADLEGISWAKEQGDQWFLSGGGGRDALERPGRVHYQNFSLLDSAVCSIFGIAHAITARKVALNHTTSG